MLHLGSVRRPLNSVSKPLSFVSLAAFVFDRSFLWIAIVSGALGFLRCFIQTPLPLVIAEEYSSRFATAFSLYMVICGVVSLICGPVIGKTNEIFQDFYL